MRNSHSRQTGMTIEYSDRSKQVLTYCLLNFIQRKNVSIYFEYFQVGTPTQDRKQGDVRTPGGPGDRTPSGGDKASPSSKPPALISEKERRMREIERERADASLEVKKNENHQILKENLELKRQMEERQRQMGYNPNELQARTERGAGEVLHVPEAAGIG